MKKLILFIGTALTAFILFTACGKSDFEQNKTNSDATPSPEEITENDVADFDNTESISITEQDLFAESHDKAYAIYYGKSSGGTVSEILRREVIFHNCTTDEYKSLGFTDVGNSTDSVNEEWGFFSNGDVYHFNFDRFDIYKKGMESDNPAFRLTDKFHLGELKNSNCQARYLHAIRRDPDDGTFIVVYSEIPNSLGANIYTDKSESVMKVNYEIGFLNKDGVWTDSISTSCPVLCHNNGYYRVFTNVNMYITDNQLNVEVAGRETGDVYTKGFLHLDTKEFVPLKTYMGKDNIIYNIKKPEAVSADGNYALYKVNSDYYVMSAILLNTATNETINLGECSYTGFLPDGTVFLQTAYDYNIVNIHGANLFKLSDKFALGPAEDGRTIHLNEVYRKDDGSYLFIYFITDDSTYNIPSDPDYAAQAEKGWIINNRYQLAITDTNANVIRTVDTGKYVEIYKSFWASTYINLADANTLVFYDTKEENIGYQVTVNLITGECVYTDYR